ncbi:MAG: hypothetical protein HQ592_13755 [Planctomycetes bacterium]|nr:hypothetical protein [Planctomycetota bacterium]
MAAAFALAVVLASAGGALGLDITWDGNGDPNNGGNWSNPLNWQDNSLPAPDDNVIIPVNSGAVERIISIDTNTTIHSLRMQVPSNAPNTLRLDADLNAGTMIANEPMGSNRPRIELNGHTFTFGGNNTDNHMFGSVGNGRYVKEGTGDAKVYPFSALSDDFTGTIVINGGTVYTEYSGLGNAANVAINEGGTLLIKNDVLPGLAIGNAIFHNGNGSATPTFDYDKDQAASTAAPFTLNSDSTFRIRRRQVQLEVGLAGTGKVIKTGAGLLILAGMNINQNANGEALDIMEGKVQITAPIMGNIFIAAGATLKAMPVDIGGTVSGPGTWDQSATTTWDGGATLPANKNNDGNWSDAANWTSNILPHEAHIPTVDGQGSSGTNDRVISVNQPLYINLLVWDGNSSAPYNSCVTFNADSTLHKLSEACDARGYIEIPAGKVLTIDHNEVMTAPKNLIGAGELRVDSSTQLKMHGWPNWNGFTGTFRTQSGAYVGGFWNDPGGNFVYFGNANIVVEAGSMISAKSDGWQMAASMTLNGHGLAVHSRAHNVDHGAFRFITQFGHPSYKLTQNYPITVQTDATIGVTIWEFYRSPGDSYAYTVTLQGPIDGAGQLRKVGTGFLRFQGNTLGCTGGLLVDQGAVELDTCTVTGDCAVATPPGTVYWPSTFDPGDKQNTIAGNAAINGKLTMENGTRLFPRAVTPTTSLTVDGIQTFTCGSAQLAGCTFEVAINNAAGTAATNWNFLDAGASLALTATQLNPLTVEIVSFDGDTPGEAANFDPAGSYTWKIAEADAPITGFDDSATSIDAAGFPTAAPALFYLVVSENGLELQLLYNIEPPPPPLEGDVNGDCFVNILDMIAVRNHLNANVNSPPSNAAYDVNDDGWINVLDMLYVRNRLNDTCAQP